MIVDLRIKPKILAKTNGSSLLLHPTESREIYIFGNTNLGYWILSHCNFYPSQRKAKNIFNHNNGQLIKFEDINKPFIYDGQYSDSIADYISKLNAYINKNYKGKNLVIYRPTVRQEPQTYNWTSANSNENTEWIRIDYAPNND